MSSKKPSGINAFEYVRDNESQDRCTPSNWIVVRLDGKNFHRFSDAHNFTKPNDERALELMSRAALCVMQEINELVLAYGQSDEFSFAFKKKTKLYDRRKDKLMSVVCSLFTAAYMEHWNEYFPETKKKHLPSFDGRVVLYSENRELRDYFRWRQADCHINNLYNTTFWSLVQKGNLSPAEAELRLQGTLASDKHEILFSEFGINYNNELELFKKGTVLFREKKKISCLNVDIIRDQFWEDHKQILGEDK